MGKSKARGLDTSFINIVKSNEKLMDYFSKMENKKLFVGIRNNYFNFYYKGASAAKIEIKKHSILCTTSYKYYGENKPTDKTVSIDEFDLDKVIHGIDKYLDQSKNTNEKECQQNIIMANNRPGSNSDWFCIDMEYVMEKESNNIPNFGRFDIIAISKNRDKESGKFKVALVELKVGNASFGNVSKYFSNLVNFNNYKKGLISINNKNSIGSGILGHFSDFVRYLEDKDRYILLKEEICNIIKNYQDLNLFPIDVNLGDINIRDLEEKPMVVFLTYSGDQNEEYVKNSFKRYILNKKVAGRPCSIYNVSDMWDETGIKYISKFKYVFREGIVSSTEICPIFKDINISESADINNEY